MKQDSIYKQYTQGSRYINPPPSLPPTSKPSPPPPLVAQVSISYHWFKLLKKVILNVAWKKKKSLDEISMDLYIIIDRIYSLLLYYVLI